MIIYLVVFINLFFFISTSLIFSPFICNDFIRSIIANISGFFLHYFCYFLLNDKIIFLNYQCLPNEKINFINSNHSYQFDTFVVIYFLFFQKISSYKISSISTNISISFIDRSILNIIDACTINSKSYYNDIKNSIYKWISSNYNRYVITFFEGTAKCDANYCNNLNILKPKLLGFVNIIKNLNNEIENITDLNIIYTLNKKILHCSNKQLIYLIFTQNVKIYVQVNKYKLPSDKNSSEWIQKLYENKNTQINDIKLLFDLK